MPNNYYDSIPTNELRNLSMFHKARNGADIPVNRLVGFQQVPQDQYVDNKTTSEGYGLVDRRTPMQIGYDNTIQNQGLYDASLDVMFPAGQLAGGVLRGASGLGLKGIGYMEGLREANTINTIADVGRRSAMQTGAGLVGGATLASSPIVGLATKGLGLGGELTKTVGNVAFNPATTAARKDLSLGMIQQISNGIARTKQLGRDVIPAVGKVQNDMAQIVDDTLLQLGKNGKVVSPRDVNGKAMDPSMYIDNKWVPLKQKEFINSRGKTVHGKEEYLDPRDNVWKSYSKLHATEPGDIYRGSTKGGRFRLSNDVVEAMGQAGHGKDKFFGLSSKLESKREQAHRIAKKATNKYNLKVASNKPVMEPKVLANEISKRQKKLIKMKRENQWAEQYNKTSSPYKQKIHTTDTLENELKQLTKQLNTISKTGKIGKPTPKKGQ